MHSLVLVLGVWQPMLQSNLMLPLLFMQPSLSLASFRGMYLLVYFVWQDFLTAGFSTINNVLGPRLAFILGTLGYPLYISSYLYVLLQVHIINKFTRDIPRRVLKLHPDTGAFVITSGAVLGFCAALLWTAQGSLMMAYPTESQKGLYIGIFWAIFNLGGVVGSSVAFGENFHSQNNNGAWG